MTPCEIAFELWRWLGALLCGSFVALARLSGLPPTTALAAGLVAGAAYALVTRPGLLTGGDRVR